MAQILVMWSILGK